MNANQSAPGTNEQFRPEATSGLASTSTTPDSGWTRRRALLAGTGAIALSLAACSGGSDDNRTPGTTASDAPGPQVLDDAQGVTTISLWHGLGATNGEALEAAVSAFNTANSGKIEVKSSFQGSYADLLAKYTAALRDNSTPTVLLASDIGSGYLRDVQRNISASAMAKANPDDLDLDEIRDAGRNYYSVDDDMFAVPMNMSTPVLWVNNDLATAAGINPATDLGTLADIAAAATKIKATTGAAGLVQPFDGWWFEQLTAASGRVYGTPENGRGEKGNITGLSVDAADQVLAFQTLAEIYTSGAGLDTGVDGNAALTAFTAGQVGLMFNSSGAAGTIAAANAPFTYSALPYPLSGDSDKSGPVIGGAALWLSATAPDVQKVAGWKLISHMASAQTQQTFSAATGYVPVNSTVDELPERLQYLTANPNTKVFADQINNTPSVVASAGCLSGAMTAIRAAVVPQMQSAFTGTISLEEALDKAKADADTAIKNYTDQLG